MKPFLPSVLGLLLLLPGFSFALAAEPSFTVTQTASRTFRLSELKKALPVQTIEADDPVYHRKMRYRGFALNSVLALTGPAQWKESEEVVYTSIDGYSPNMEASLLNQYHAWLVFETTEGPFPMITQGKSRISPGPFYVVWSDLPKEMHTVPWPYQLASMEVIPLSKKYSKIFPDEHNQKAVQGFRIFKAECLKCHSMNLEGGDLGPELNTPKSVTEYWSEEHLRAYIHDNAQYRARSKMPSYQHLTDEQIGLILEYLKSMKGRK